MAPADTKAALLDTLAAHPLQRPLLPRGVPITGSRARQPICQLEDEQAQTSQRTQAAMARKPGVAAPEQLAAFVRSAGEHLIVVDARNLDFAVEPGDEATHSRAPIAGSAGEVCAYARGRIKLCRCCPPCMLKFSSSMHSHELATKAYK